MFLTITKHCVFTSVNESSLNSKNNYCNMYGNKTYRFLMREIGIFTGVGNGFQEAGWHILQQMAHLYVYSDHSILEQTTLLCLCL